MLSVVIGYSQCEDRVTKREGKKTTTGTEVICLHKDKYSFCNKLDKVLMQIYAMQNG